MEDFGHVRREGGREGANSNERKEEAGEKKGPEKESTYLVLPSCTRLRRHT